MEKKIKFDKKNIISQLVDELNEIDIRLEHYKERYIEKDFKDTYYLDYSVSYTERRLDILETLKLVSKL